MSAHTSNRASRPPGAGVGRAAAVVLVAVVAFVAVVPGGATADLRERGPIPTGEPADPAGPPPEDPGDDANGSTPEPPAVEHPRVADGLLSGTPARVAAPDGGTRTVVVETAEGASDAVARTIDRYGSVRVHHGTLIEATLPRSAITAVADREGVEFVRAPHRLRKTGTGAGNVTSEGVAAIGADEAHAANYTGEGVTVAVIDTGFDLDDPEIADAVVGTKDFTGDGFGDALSDHGTATAEIVTDTAPGARIVAVKARTYTQLVEAAEWVDEEGTVDVVSMSLGIAGGAPLNGSARADRAIAQSVHNGTTWVVSAGNLGDGNHWNGTWRDPDGDGWLNFRGSDENLSVEAPMSVTLQWSDWYESDQDYDLYVYDASGTLVTSSGTVQAGTQSPMEQVSVSEEGTYYLKVRRANASGTAEFDLFYAGFTRERSRPEYWTSARSVTVPATGPKSTAVGAVAVGNLTLEPFSSRGPTIDGRRKPAFVAPDRVTTGSIAPFPGTSAAAPHAAGAVALLLDADPELSPEAAVARLANTADPLNRSALPDNAVGAGLIDASEAVRPADPVGTRIRTDPITALNAEEVRVGVRFGVVPDGGEVVVQLRDGRGATVTNRTAANTRNRTTVVTVDASALADGPVTARARIVGGLGHSNPEGFTAGSVSVRKDTAGLALSLSQTVSTATVEPGGTVTVTSRATPSKALDQLTLTASFGPNVSGATVTSFRVAGNGSTFLASADANRAAFAARDVAAGSTVVAVYEVRIAPDVADGTALRIDTETSGGGASGTVSNEVRVVGTAAYANESGVVGTAGLQAAIEDWARGEISTDRLQRVISAWATGGKLA